MSQKAYSIIKGLSVLIALTGLLALADHIAGQVHRGHASAESLVGGAIAFGLGCLFFVLADIGEKVSR